MDVKITKSDGSMYLLSDFNIVVQDFVVSSVEIIPSYERVEGRSGSIDYGAEYGTRSITIPFYIEAYDMADYPLLRDELYNIIVDTEPYYVEELRRITYGKGGNKFVGGKRYKVRIENGIMLEQSFTYGFGELVAMTSELPFAESIGTSMYPKTFDSGFWQVGQGLKTEDLKYAHDTNTFSIYNAGNVTVDPVDGMMLEITYQGASDGLEIKNITTGEAWQYNGETEENDTIFFDGIQPLKNDLNIFRDTNRRIITLAHGWNDFELSGTIEEFLISFNFRFYYL